MIGIITFIISLLIFGVLFGAFKGSTYAGEPDKYGDVRLKPLGIIKAVTTVLIAFILGIFIPYEVERVDSGKVAILVDNIGDSKGMAKVEYKRGWVLYNTFTQQYYEFPVYQQHIDYEENTIITKGGFQVTIRPSFNYALNPTAVDQMFQNLRVDIKTVEQGWLRKIARAKGDSAQAVIAAAGRAEAVKKEQQFLTPMYIEYIKVQKWKGEVPTTVLGSNGSVLLNLK